MTRAHLLRPLLGAGIGFGLAVAAWPLMGLPFSNPLGIVGVNVVKQFNPANNVLRYLLVVVLPAIGFVLGEGWQRVANAPVMFSEARERRVWLFGALGLLWTWALVRALAVFGQAFDTAPLDFFHGGESLSAGFNHAFDGGIWTKSFFVHGAIYDPLHTVWAWKHFGHQSIGAERLGFELWLALVPPALALLLTTLALCLRDFWGETRATALVLVCLASYVLSENKLHYLDARDAYALLALSLGIAAFRMPLLALPAGIVAGLGMFNTIERGAYVIAALGIGFLLLRRVWLYLFGLCAAAAVAWALFGPEELAAFAKGLAYWVRQKELMDGYAYPMPFSKTSSIYTLPMIFNALSLLGFAAALPTYKKLGQPVLAAIHGTLVAVAIAYFRSALGRCDAAHVMYAASLAHIVFAFTLVLWCSRGTLHALASAALVSVLLFLLPALLSRVEQRQQMAKFSAVTKAYSALPDSTFLQPGENAALEAFAKAFADEPCAYIYPSSPAWSYLLKKPTCSRFYVTWFATAAPHQIEVIADLERTKPRVILWDGPEGEPDGFLRSQSVAQLDAYLRAHYTPAEKISGWQIARRVAY